jgi:hypothetical protein
MCKTRPVFLQEHIHTVHHSIVFLQEHFLPLH